MENPRTAMIAELATTENFLVINELVELWQEILFEHNKKLFDSAFAVEIIWEGYRTNYMLADQVIEIIPSKADRYRFRFVINVGNSDRNWFFGIKGPWDLATKHMEIVTLKDACIQHNLKLSWANWKFMYFDSKRSDVYGLLSQQADATPVLVAMVRQFLNTCAPLKDQVERINDMLLTG